ncbi:MAG TPA: DUF2878 domain-containing protein [Vicinamibacterales bacterium]|nr:DUF2878 domain-containing protein [Vicinamibacterales bacterium]
MTRAINYTLYQVGWFACVLGASYHRPWLGTLLGTLTLAVHLALATRSSDETKLALTAGLVGIVVESIQIGLGTLSYERGVFAAALPPGWLIVVWMQFATTLRFSLRWLDANWWAPIAFGAIGGPLAYFVADGLDVVQLHPAVWPSMLSLALLWSVAVPVIVSLGRRQHGQAGEGSYALISAAR